MQTRKVLHYPRLDNVLVIEKIIYNTSGTYTKKRLWDILPKKMMYQTFSLIIDYLLYSGKIAIDKEGKIGWIYHPEGVAKYMNKKHLFWNREGK